MSANEVSPRCAIVLDEVRTSSLDYFGCLSSFQWEGVLRPKSLEAGFRLEQIQVLPLKNLESNLSLLDGVGLIVGLGEASLRFFTDRRSIDKWHLSPLETKCGRKFLGSFDLSRLNSQYELNLYLKLTLRRAFEEFSSPLPYDRPEERFLLNPPLWETYAALDEIERADLIAVDVETGYGQINTVGFAWSPSDAIAINVLPDRLADASYFELWSRIARILEGPAKKVFQNFIYDVSYISAYGIRTQNIHHDTMWGMKVLWPELDMGLGNVGRIYTRRPYWKDDGKVEAEEGKKKDWGNVRDWTKHYTYNCLSKDMKIRTEQGWMPIGQVARKKMKLKVYSWNESLDCFEWRTITNWLVKKEPENINWTVIETTGMSGKHGLHVTPDHQILTHRGWKRADRVKVGDCLLNEGLRHQAGTVMGTVLGDSSLQLTSDKSVAYLSCAQVKQDLVELKQFLFGGTLSKTHRTTGYKTSDFWELYVPACAQFAKLKTVPVDIALNYLTPMGIALWIMDDGCVQKGKSPFIKLALQSYNEEERNTVLTFFRTRYNETKGSLDSAGNMSFTVGMTKSLCREIGCFVVPSMRYKLPYESPEFSHSECEKFRSVVGPISVAVTKVRNSSKTKRGYSTSYCVSVDGNENFLTEYGVVKNCRDTTGTLEAALKQREDLQDRDLEGFFDSSIMSLAEPLLEMCGNGFPLDLERRSALKQETEAKVAELTARLKVEAGQEINPRSSKQKINYIKSLGVKVPKKYDKDKGAYRETADSAALKKILLKNPEHSALKTMIEIAGLDKALSSYINFDVKEGDPNVRFSLGKFTETLRLAGGTDPWNRGFNIQTIPREGGEVSIKSMLAAPEGFSFVEVDLRQAESRFVAYRAPEPRLIEMLESGEDVHKHVALEILKGLRKPSSEYNKEWRQLGKKSGHAANYMTKAKTLVESCFTEMDVILTLKEGEAILEAYHTLFPGIRTWHREVSNQLYRTRKLTAPTGWVRYFYGRPGPDMDREGTAWEPQHTIPWVNRKLMFFLIDERRKGNLTFRLLSEVHDAIYMLVPDGEVEPLVEACLRTEEWAPKIKLPGGTLVIPTEVKVGKRLSEMKDCEL